MEAKHIYEHLNFCPECGRELEKHPISVWKACYYHGNLVISDGKIVWEFTSSLGRRNS